MRLALRSRVLLNLGDVKRDAYSVEETSATQDPFTRGRVWSAMRDATHPARRNVR